MAGRVMGPLKSVREHCVDCCGGYRSGINSPAGCNSPKCSLFPLRFGKGVEGVNVLKAIRAKCLCCVGYQRNEVRDCTDHDCECYPFRMGHNPNLKGKGRGGRNGEHLKRWREERSRAEPAVHGELEPPESLCGYATASGSSASRGEKSAAQQQLS